MTNHTQSTDTKLLTYYLGYSVNNEEYDILQTVLEDKLRGGRKSSTNKLRLGTLRKEQKATVKQIT